MAKKKARGKGFQKGNKAAVGKGRPAMSEDEKALALATRTQFKLLLAQYASWSMDQIKNALKEASLPVIDMAVLKHLQLMHESGSMDRVDWTLNHVMGKPKEVSHVRLTATTNNKIDPKKLSKEDLLALKEIHEKAGK